MACFYSIATPQFPILNAVSRATQRETAHHHHLFLSLIIFVACKKAYHRHRHCQHKQRNFFLNSIPLKSTAPQRVTAQWGSRRRKKNKVLCADGNQLKCKMGCKSAWPRSEASDLIPVTRQNFGTVFDRRHLLTSSSIFSLFYRPISSVNNINNNNVYIYNDSWKNYDA